MDDVGVLVCRSDGLHFHLNGFNTVALICTDVVFGSFRGFECGDGKPFFIVVIDDFTDLSQGILTKFGMGQLDKLDGMI